MVIKIITIMSFFTWIIIILIFNINNFSLCRYKPTVVYDPAKSETFRALQEEVYGGEIQEVSTPAQTKVFQPTKTVQFKVILIHIYCFVNNTERISIHLKK